LGEGLQLGKGAARIDLNSIELGSDKVANNPHWQGEVLIQECHTAALTPLGDLRPHPTQEGRILSKFVLTYAFGGGADNKAAIFIDERQSNFLKTTAFFFLLNPLGHSNMA